MKRTGRIVLKPVTRKGTITQAQADAAVRKYKKSPRK